MRFLYNALYAYLRCFDGKPAWEWLLACHIVANTIVCVASLLADPGQGVSERASMGTPSAKAIGKRELACSGRRGDLGTGAQL